MDGEHFFSGKLERARDALTLFIVRIGVTVFEIADAGLLHVRFECEIKLRPATFGTQDAQPLVFVVALHESRLHTFCS